MTTTAKRGPEGYIDLEHEPGKKETLIAHRILDELVRKANALHALGRLTQDDMEWPYTGCSGPYGDLGWARDRWENDLRIAFDEGHCDVCECPVGECLDEDPETGHPRGRSIEVAWHPRLILCEDCWTYLPAGEGAR
jgi:hypothetical protein